MYTKYATVVNIDRQQSHALHQFKLKQHHHIRLDNEFKQDCNVWLQFLTDELGNIVNRPVIDLLSSCVTSHAIEFYLDASKMIGFGALLNHHWIRGDWDKTLISEQDPSIAYLELYALCTSVLTWETHEDLVNTQITVYCDNTAVVEMINSTVSSCKNCMYLLWLLTLNGLKYNRQLTAQYIDTKSNFLADAFSRNQMDRFRRLGPAMNTFPDKIPEILWPVSKVWN